MTWLPSFSVTQNKKPGSFILRSSRWIIKAKNIYIFPYKVSLLGHLKNIKIFVSLWAVSGRIGGSYVTLKAKYYLFFSFIVSLTTQTVWTTWNSHSSGLCSHPSISHNMGLDQNIDEQIYLFSFIQPLFNQKEQIMKLIKTKTGIEQKYSKLE